MKEELFRFKASKHAQIANRKAARNKGDSSISKYKIGDSKKFSIEDLVEQVMGRDAAKPLDLVIDDSAMPEAANYFEFLTEERFLGIQAWARQIEIGVRLFSDYCPACSDVEWFKRPDKHKLAIDKKAKPTEILRHLVLMEYDVCPKCKLTKWHFMRKKDARLPYYNELTGVAGQRASKSAMVGMHSSYVVHKYLKLQRPTQVLGLLKATILHCTFVALTFDQARENLWDPFYNLVTTSPWFAEYHRMLSDYEATTGEKLFKVMDTFMVYRHRNLHINPSGPNMKTLRGRTRLLAALDELGWFDNEADNNKVKMNAHEVYIALERSLLTVRSAAEDLLRRQRVYVIPALMQNVSSPSSRKDKIMMLLKESESNPNMLGFHHATWEINPTLSRRSASIVAAFNADPLAAARDYGAEPPLSANPFFDSVEQIEKAMVKVKNGIKLDPKHTSRTDGSRFTYADIIACKESGKPSILALDAGYSGNSFAFAICQLSDRNVGQINVPVMGEIIPKMAHPINFSRVYTNVIAPLIQKRNVRLIVADRWQSIKVLQDAVEEFKDLQHKIYSLTYEDLTLVKDNFYSGNIRIPAAEMPTDKITEFDPSKYPSFFTHKPVAHCVLQMLTVRDTGKEVVKGDGLTDDIWRALALGATFCLDKEYQKMLNEPARATVEVGLGAVFGRGGGASTASGSAAGVGFISSRSG